MSMAPFVFRIITSHQSHYHIMLPPILVRTQVYTQVAALVQVQQTLSHLSCEEMLLCLL